MNDNMKNRINELIESGETIPYISKNTQLSEYHIRTYIFKEQETKIKYNNAQLKKRINIFLEKSKNIHNNKYEYDIGEYKTYNNIIKIKCPIHGWFKQKARDHLNGAGCPKCSNIRNANSKKNTKDYFIQKAKERFGEYYDYNKVNYTAWCEPVIIICPVHGEFEQEPRIHIKCSVGCPKCSQEITNTRNCMTWDDFIEKANKIYKSKFEYQNIGFYNRLSFVKVYCKKHGWFKQKASNHLKCGCPKCSREIVTNNQCIDINNFIKRSNIIHNNKYDYSKICFKTIKDKVIIICPDHGEFEQQIAGHLQGNGCPKCGVYRSQYEDFIEQYLTKNNIPFEKKYKLKYDHNNWFELDFYIPTKNIAIEVNGIFWHSEAVGRDKNYHLFKTDICQQNNIRLIHIFTHLIDHKSELVINRLNSIFGIYRKRIYARECNVRLVDSKKHRIFLNSNHLQGVTNASIRLGLFYENRLIAIMSFGKLRKVLGQNASENEYELYRFACLGGYMIVGGASKLLSAFIKNYSPKKIITYADRCWTDGLFYEKIGFDFDHYSKPGYWYVKDNNVYHRYKFAKHVLKSQLKYFDSELSEWENMKNNKYTRYWDCGNIVYTKFINN